MELNRFALVLIAGALACGDGTAPDPVQGPNAMTLSLCPAVGGGMWAAYRNEGGPWTQLTPNSNSQVSFNATDKFSIAISESFFGSAFTVIVNTSAAELRAGEEIPCEDLDFGTKTMSGTIAGLTGNQTADISAGAASDFGISASFPSWSLEDLPSAAVDVIATRNPETFGQPVDRIFVRRGVTPQNSSIGALDFNGAESASPQSAVVTFTGAGTNGFVSALSQIQTANGTQHVLNQTAVSSGSTGSGSFTYLSLPATKRLSTDQHTLALNLSEDTGSRSIDYLYSTPTPISLAFGPMIAQPTITNVGTGPVRPRMVVGAQPEYPFAIMAEYDEFDTDFSGRSVIILTTASFLGGAPTTWDVTVPDMSAANYNPASGLHTTSYDWSVTAESAPQGTTPADGTTILSATRSKSPFSPAGRVVRSPLRFPRLARR